MNIGREYIEPLSVANCQNVWIHATGNFPHANEMHKWLLGWLSCYFRFMLEQQHEPKGHGIFFKLQCLSDMSISPMICKCIICAISRNLSHNRYFRYNRQHSQRPLPMSTQKQGQLEIATICRETEKRISFRLHISSSVQALKYYNRDVWHTWP